MIEAPSPPPRPNIVLILADDMGFSDIGCFGSEIRTPNLDALAARGVRFTQMYNAARCCPTRASLLTGQYPHRAGVGHMVDDRGVGPAYQGFLRWEHEGNRAVRDGDWKLVSANGGPWELYNMAEDRTELHDLAAVEPDRVASLAARYDAWAAATGILPWPLKRAP